MFKLRAPIALVVAALWLASFAQPALADDPLRIRITQADASAFPDVRMVMSVVDAQDRPVGDLAAREIVVSEDGRAQAPGVEIASEVAPIALSLVLDTSGSMAGRPITDAKAAISQLIRSLGPKDQAALLTFNTRVNVDAALTADKDALVAATNNAAAGGDTAIFDAVARAMDVLAPLSTQTRRAIVLLTDGVDNSSTLSRATVLDRARGLGYPIYVVGLGTTLDRPTLQSFADASRGEAFVAPTPAQLSSIYAGLSARIATQYLLSYRSNVRTAPAGSQLTLTVQIVRAGTVLGTATTTITVPVGHDVTPSAAPTVEPARPAVNIVIPTKEQAPYSPELVALLGTASVLSLLLWVFAITTTTSLQALERRRVTALAADAAEAAPRDRTSGRSFAQRVIIPALAKFGRRLERFSSASFMQKTELRLTQAGAPFELGAPEFVGLQVGCAFAGAAIVAGLTVFALSAELGWVLLTSLGGALVGILVPNIWLERAVKARRRQILRALPSALDMLALAARAGLTFDGAISQVVQRWENPLSEEFRRVLADFRIGRNRRDALRAMVARTGVPDISRFTNAIIQADALGVPISKVLLDQSVEMRTRRRQRAEESARIAPVKMLFPMVGLIFPALFVVVLGPAVPRFMSLFGAY